jgi:hypothetical protein
MSKADRSLLPCATCPWRAGKDASTIPRYEHEKACGLMNSVGEGDAFRPIMACHHSTDGQIRTCRGYLARAGWSNINVRVLLSRGQIKDPSDVFAACEKHGVQLEPDYPTVLAKLEASR